MSVLAWIALGLIGGVIAGWLWRSRGRALAGDAAAGMLGAVLGGFMASVMLGIDVTNIELTSLVVAALGAAILIMLLHALPPTEVFE